jgi:hypothetical protein
MNNNSDKQEHEQWQGWGSVYNGLFFITSFLPRYSSQVMMLEFSSNLEHTTLKKKILLELWCLKNPPKLLWWAWTLEKINLASFEFARLIKKSKEAGMKRNENKNSKIDGCPNVTLNKKLDRIFRKTSVWFRFSSHLELTLRFPPGSIPNSVPCRFWFHRFQNPNSVPVRLFKTDTRTSSYPSKWVPGQHWILQSHTLHLRTLFVSLITKCNLPYKYTKSSVRHVM